MFGLDTTMSSDKHCPWEITDALKVFAFYFLMMGLGSTVLLAVVREILGQDPIAVYGANTVALSLSLLTNGLTCLYILYTVNVRRRQPIAALGISTSEWKRNLTGGLSLYLIILPIILTAGFLVELMTKNVGITPEHQDVVNRFMEERSSSGILAIIAFGALIGPVTEEVLFRGFLQPVLRDAMGSIKAILITSLLFALVHFNAYIFLQIFILGLLLGYLYEKTGTLIAPTAVHVLHNSVSMCVLLWMKRGGGLL